MPENKHLRRGLILVYTAVAVLAVWLFWKYLLPWLLPFIVAFLISRFIEPLVRFLVTRARFKRAIASLLCTLLVFAVLIALFAGIIWRIVLELTTLARDMPTLLTELTGILSALRDRLNIFINTAPLEVQETLQNAIDGVMNSGTDFIPAITGWILGIITSVASVTPRLVLFIFTCAISTYFISSGYKDVTAFIMRQLPEKHHTAIRELRSGLIGVFGRWIKAEAMLSGIAFVQLLIVFLIMRIQFAIILALLLGLIDLIPLIGIGSVLVPWAIISVITGNYTRAVVLIITFGVISTIRNILEPKLVGSQIGLPPIATLLAIYVGFSAIGIFGMVLFPIGLVVLKHINDREYVRLWR